MNSAPKWIIRPAGPDDIPFIYSTWLNSYRTGSGLGLASGKYAYYLTYNCIIDHILSRDETLALVAAKADDPFVIYGYLIADPLAVHYAFVKEAFWRCGIARALYESIGPCPPTSITHKTKLLAPILGKHPEFDYKPTHLFTETREGVPYGEGNSSSSN